MSATNRSAAAPSWPVVDPVLACTGAALLLLGLVMVGSASISLADRALGNPQFYIWRQALFAVVGCVALVFALAVPSVVWQKTGFLLMPFALLMLAVVLVPGIGHEVNGSVRWIPLGPINFQVSEAARLLVILYLSGYIVRRREILQSRFSGFAMPMLLVFGACALLLAEPDFGAATVLMATALALMFVGGVRLRDFALLFAVVAVAMAVLALTSPYRMERLTAFLDPWADPFDTGFQLTQSLIAIGRGEWFGVGLGGSVQKLFYLPEAHTDFVFAVLAEELGLAGVAVTLALYCALVWRALNLAWQAAAAGLEFQAFVACGIGFWLGLQTFVNIGVNMGVLPTKGLTLPLMSYGGSSLVPTLAALGLLLRVHHETQAAGRRPRRSKPQ